MSMGTPSGPGTTTYSANIPGQRANYRLSVKFDVTDGCLGITQTLKDGTSERVLLSPGQVYELRRFMHKNGLKG